MTTNIPQKDFKEEFSHNYMSYANHVIMDRAIPSVEDGFKPVHRRIIYAMYDRSWTHEKATVKCAKVVGEVLGNWHPHGDQAVYEALMGLGQEFKTRYPLIGIQGNKGSIDDPKGFAAMRYTEARLSKFAQEYLQGLKEKAVEFTNNFDESRDDEPVVLPCKIPLPCLLNGTHGIGVSLATSIPPHNLSELVDGTLHYLENPECTIEDLMQFIKGPDFPTGGSILGTRDIHQMYTTGRGSIPIRAKIEVVEKNKNRHLLITELPYSVTPEEIMGAIGKLIEEKKVTGIGIPTDETKRDVRIIIPLKKDANPQYVISALCKYTRLQTSFGANLIVLAEDKESGKRGPQRLNLKEFVEYYVKFRTSVLVKEHEFKLKKAEDKLHELDGLVIALENLDNVIQTIRGADSADVARQQLINTYGLSEIQSNKVLEMQLRKLASLEREKIFQEQRETINYITDLKDILAKPERIVGIIKDQLIEIKQNYGDDRLTEIELDATSSIDLEATIPNIPTTIMVTRMGYIKSIPINAVNEQRKGTKGSKGIDILDNDYLVDVFNCMKHDQILIFTNKAKVYSLKAYLIPEKSKNVKGTNLINLLPFDSDELVSAVIPMNKENTQDYIMFATKNGLACRVDVSSYELKIKRGVKAIKLKDGDELLTAKLCNERDIAVFGTDSGYFVKIKCSEFGARQSRTSSGIRAMTMKKGGKVVGFDIIDEENNSDLMIVTKKGIGKKINISEIQSRNRGAVGSAFIKMKEKADAVASFCLIKSNSLILITSNGVINRLSPEDIKALKGRAASGSTVMRLSEGDELSSISNAIEEDVIDEEQSTV